MKRVLIAGIGNVLLGDDGIGPYVVQLLESNYAFEEGVEIVDVGTPALDFIDHLDGLDVLIVVDAVRSDGEPGAVALYDKADLLRHVPSVRMDPHSPALTECLLAAEFRGSGPREVLLIGVHGESYEAGCGLSLSVHGAAEQATREVLRALDRWDVGFIRRYDPTEASIWWMEPVSQVA